MTTHLAQRYQLKQPLGQGGMATVYQAFDTQLQRDVALKVLRADLQNDPNAIAQFQREAQISASFNHPHIAHVYDVGVDPQYGTFFVQELVAGRSLDAIVPVPATQALEWGREIASALAAIHQRGIIHCDVKPHNVKITPDNHAMLLDFGIAQTNGTSPDDIVYGTPQYMAPERAQGEAASPATDVYALGVMLYEMLTGRVPIDGGSAYEIVQQHIHAGIPSLRQAMPGAAATLEQIIQQATNRDPAQRYQSVEEMAQALNMVQMSANAHTVATNVVRPRATVSIHNMATKAMSTPQSSAVPPMMPQRPVASTNPMPAAPAIAAKPAAATAKKPPLILWVIGAMVLLALLAMFLKRGDDATAVVDTSTPTITKTAQAIVPNLVGKSRDEAQQIADQNQWQLVVNEVNADAPAGNVVSQEPAADTPLDANGTLTVNISQAAPAEVVPPPSNDKGKDSDKGKGKGKKDK